jgi:hypothetical protein
MLRASAGLHPGGVQLQDTDLIEIPDWEQYLPADARREDREYSRTWRPPWIMFPTTQLRDPRFDDLTPFDQWVYFVVVFELANAPLRVDAEHATGQRTLSVKGLKRLTCLTPGVRPKRVSVTLERLEQADLIALCPGSASDREADGTPRDSTGRDSTRSNATRRDRTRWNSRGRDASEKGRSRSSSTRREDGSSDRGEETEDFESGRSPRTRCSGRNSKDSGTHARVTTSPKPEQREGGGRLGVLCDDCGAHLDADGDCPECDDF